MDERDARFAALRREPDLDLLRGRRVATGMPGEDETVWRLPGEDAAPWMAGTVQRGLEDLAAHVRVHRARRDVRGAADAKAERERPPAPDALREDRERVRGRARDAERLL